MNKRRKAVQSLNVTVKVLQHAGSIAGVICFVYLEHVSSSMSIILGKSFNLIVIML